MKTLKSIIATVALLISLNSIAGNNSNITSANIQKEIQLHLTVKVEQSQKVEVVFTTDETGKVNLAIAKTDNAELKKSIEANFLSLHFGGIKNNTAYSIVINLQVI
jgi:endo-beta-N-acetylglucosaminidase D